MKKLMTIALALLMILSLFAGCQSTPATPATTERIEVVYWHTMTDNHEVALLERIEKFNASQELYTVVAQQQPYSEVKAKLMQATAAGVGPDIYSMFPTEASFYMKENYLYDLRPFIDDPEIGIPNYDERYPEGTMRMITFDNPEKLYLMPPSSATGEVLYYNKTMFDALNIAEPKTWTDIENASKKIYEAYGIPGFGSDSITDTYQTLIMQAGSNYIDAATNTMDIDRTIGLEKLNWFVNGCKEGYFRLVGEDFYFSNPFGSQAIGMYIGSSAGMMYAEMAIPAEGTEGHFEMAVCPVPQEGPVKYISNWAGGYVVLSKDEAHAKGSYEFIKYLTSLENGIHEVLSNPGNMPIWEELANDPQVVEYVKTDAATKAMMEQREYLGYLPSPKGADDVRTEIDKMIQTAALGTVDTETAFDTMIAACNAILAQ